MNPIVRSSGTVSALRRFGAMLVLLAAVSSSRPAGAADATVPGRSTGEAGAGAFESDPFGETVSARVNDAALRARDLRTRILYSRRSVFEQDGLGDAEEPIGVESLIEQARGATDPLVLELLLSRCRSVRDASRCDAVDIANRWTVADAQNQVAWLALAATLHDAGDVSGARTAFGRAALASTWHEAYLPVARLIADWLVRTLPRLRRVDAEVLALSKAAATMPDYGTILAACSGAPERRDACARIVETMARDTQTAMGLTVAASLAARSSLPGATVDAIRTEADAMHWSSTADWPRLADGDGTVGPEDARIDALIAMGERLDERRQLARQGIGAADAAKRYAASLSNEQVAMRTTEVRPFVAMPRREGW